MSGLPGPFSSSLAQARALPNHSHTARQQGHEGNATHSIGCLIEGISDCKELVERIVSEAEAIIKVRLSEMAA
jgi:hypothetical protein